MNTQTYATLLTRYREISGESIGVPSNPGRLDTPAIDRQFWLDTEREFGSAIAEDFQEWLT